MRHLVYLIITAAMFLVACSEDQPPPRKNAQPHLVETVPARMVNIAVQRERTGSLRALREIQVFNQEEGRITELPYYEGDRVTAGDIVARLDDRLLLAEQKRILARQQQARKDLQRIQNLAHRKLAAEADLSRAETELAVLQADAQAVQTRLDYTRMTSPIDGVISQRLSEPGNIAERYTHLLTISDQSSLITEVQVSELLINKLRLGDPVSMTIDALAGLAFPERHRLQARITRIHPNLNPLTRTGTVEIALNPVPKGARPGQLARITLQSQQAQRLLIPFVGLRRSSEGEFVYTVGPDNTVSVVAVRTGLRIGEDIEVLSGIDAGERIVIRGFTGLRPGQQVSLLQQPAASTTTGAAQ